MTASEILKRYRLISDQVSRDEIKLVLNALDEIIDRGVAGDVCEFGCYKGTTSLFLARLLDAKRSPKRLWLYDSFAGLPEKSEVDKAGLGDEFRPGELKASKKALMSEFRHAGLPMPIIKKAWFQDLTANDLPATVAFAFLDGDYYESIKAPLGLITDRLMPNSIIVVDDYGNDHLPGARQAVDEWCARQASRIARFEERDSLAIVHML